MKNIDIFPWDDHFNTGIDTIDEQHRKLVEILNKLATMVAYQSTNEELSEIFDELTQYTVYHFDTEEVIWNKFIKDENVIEDHEAVHQKFIDTILELKQQQDTKSLHEIADEALKFLAKWLASHILESDRYMAHFALAIEDGLNIEEAKNRAQEQMSGSTKILIEIILSIYSTLSENTLHLMREIKSHNSYEEKLLYEEEYRQLLLELSTSFINLPMEEIDDAIEDGLKKMATFTRTDRAYIFDYNLENKTTTNLYEWYAKEIAPQIDRLQEIPLELIHDWYKKHSMGSSVIIHDVLELPAGNMRDILLSQNIKSLITFPLMKNDKAIGFVGFDAVKNHHQFTKTEINLLHHFSELIVNVTSRKNTHEALIHERSFLRTLIKAIPDLVWMKDLDGVYLMCNERFEDFFGAKEADIVGKTDYDFLTKELGDFFRMHDKKVMESTKPSVNEEEIPFASDGHKEFLHTTKVPVYDVNKQLVGVLGVGRDITNIKEAQKELEEKEHYQKALLDNFPFLIWLKDDQSRFLAVNQPFADACGLPSTDNLIGKNDFDVWPQQLAQMYYDDDMEVIDSKKPKNVEEPLQEKNEKKWIETYKSPVSLDNNIIGTVGYARDITERKKAEKELELAASVFSHSREGIMITSPENKIVKVNNAVEHISGYSREELLGKNPKVLSSGKQSQEYYKLMWHALNTKGYWDGEISNRHKSGEIYIEMITITTIKDTKGNVLNYVALFSDITATKEQQKRLEYIAHYDALTGLPNRVLFSDRLHQALAQTRRNQNKLAVVYLDLDGFKAINDQYGHEYGDILLSKISAKMKTVTRDGDTIARIGGDEFVAVLLNLNKVEDCVPMLERLLAIASQDITYSDITMRVSASVGVSFFNHDDIVDADQLVRYADQAMYQAKVSGKNRYHIFDAKQDEMIRLEHQGIEQVKHALEHNQFALYYQPKVNMKTGEVVGAEALIRWLHPHDGVLSPAKFLPLVDGHTLSVNIGEWVLEEAMKHLQEWGQEGLDFVVSVNIDAIHLLEGNLVDFIESLFKRYPTVNPQKLKLEILETSALEDIEHVIQIMQECKELGVSFSLDDFGTGYSSLSYLKRLPISELKIDQSFIRDMLKDTDDLAILDGIISLTETFQLNVIAEGVEEVTHGKVLVQMGCDVAQGYAIARPMPMENLKEWMKDFHSDDSWLQAKLQRRDTLFILYALIEHNSWMDRFTAFMRGEIPQMIEVKHTHCKLNKWLEQIKKYCDTSKLADLQQLHEELHIVANNVIRDKNEGLNVSDKDIVSTQGVHTQILEVLDEMKASCLNSV